MSKRDATSFLVAIGIAGTLGIAIGRTHLSRDTADPVSVPPQVKLIPTPVKLATPHLNSAEQKCEAIIDGQMVELDQFFAATKTRTGDFAAVSLGWGSKWNFVLDQLPGNSGHHRKYLHQQFDRHVFSQSDLERVAATIVKDFLYQVSMIELSMLEELQAEATNFSSSYALASYDTEALHQHYAELFKRFENKVDVIMPGEIGDDIVRLITTQLLTQLAVHLSTQGGILSLSAASGPFTGGIGVIVGLIVERIVSYVQDLWYDPAGKLQLQLNTELDLLAGTIKKECREYLQSFLKERSEVRSKVVLAMLQPAN